MKTTETDPPSHVEILRAAHARYPDAGDLYVCDGDDRCEVGTQRPLVVLVRAESRTALLRVLRGA